MKRLNIAAALLLASTVSAAQTADIARGKQIAEQVCASCHAADGNSGIAMYPRLAAQHAAYIETQTRDIKDGKRINGASAAMAPMITGLSDADIRNVAAYYAVQLPKSGEAKKDDAANEGRLALGQQIYRAGLPEKKVPACMSCHGPAGAGMPGGGTEITSFPRLAGQHAEYVVSQVKSYANGERKSANEMMEDVAKRLSEKELEAVANYIQGLN